jgi:hypothetical protein
MFQCLAAGVAHSTNNPLTQKQARETWTLLKQPSIPDCIAQIRLPTHETKHPFAHESVGFEWNKQQCF